MKNWIINRISGDLIRGIGYLFLVSGLGLYAGFLLGGSSLAVWFPRVFGMAAGLCFVWGVVGAYMGGNTPSVLLSERKKVLMGSFLISLSLGTTFFSFGLHKSAINFLLFPPWDDYSYYRQLLNWPFRGVFDQFNSRRPLNALLNILEFQLVGKRFFWFFLLRIQLLALSLSAFWVALSRKTGWIAALSSCLVVVVWAFPYASSLMSEVNGITAAVAGLALILFGVDSRVGWKIYTGIFMLCISYLLRPFNPIMPSLIALVAFFPIVENKRAALIRGGVAGLGAFAIIWMMPYLLSIYSNPNGGSNSNLSYTILGLTRGTNWKEASHFQAKTIQVSSEKQRVALMNEMAIQNIREHPEWLVKGLLIGVRMIPNLLLSEVGKGVGILVEKPIFKNKPTGKTSKKTGIAWPLKLSILVFSVLSLVLCFRIRTNSIVPWIFGLSILSFVLVAPILITSGGWRPVATLYPGLSLLMVIIPMYIRERKGAVSVLSTDSSQAIRLIPFLVLGLILFAIPFTGFYRLVSKKQDRKVHAGLEVRVVPSGKIKWLNSNTVEMTVGQLMQGLHPKYHLATRLFLKKEGGYLARIQFRNNHPFLIFRSPIKGKIPDEQGIKYIFPEDVKE